MRKYVCLFILLTVVVPVLVLTPAAYSGQPKNIIFFIGDGMGPVQVEAANLYNGGALSFESFPYQGYITTYSANAAITDSAAAATALATGYKVNGGVISIARPANPEYAYDSELPTLLEYYQGLGKSTGLVTTTFMTHATPASFGAHETSRTNFSQIAGDYLNQTQPDILLGGGANGLTPDDAFNAGYWVANDRGAMLSVTDDGVNVPKVSGQFGSNHLPYEYDGSYASLPHLSEMTEKALNLLDNDSDGMFLMVEGGRIDHAGHSNNIARNVYETLEFANAVQEAIDWASGRTDTLILVTADHETGGMGIIQDNGAGNFPTVSWSTTVHTAANVPVYAWGPNADLISGTMDNTDMFDVATVPEPATMGLLAIGAAATLLRRRRR